MKGKPATRNGSTPGWIVGLVAICTILLAPELGWAEGETESTGETQELFIIWVIKTSGPIGAFIFLLSVYFVQKVFFSFREIRMSVAIPPALASQADELLQKRDLNGLFELLKKDESPYARLITSGLTELTNGLDTALEAINGMAETITVELEKRISMMAVLGTLGPMIGLLGTLQGMINSFSVIARSDTTLKASEVAHGISEALLLTFEGVALSVPAIYFFAMFRSRVQEISVNLHFRADKFVRKVYLVYTALRKSQTGGASPAAPTASN